MFLILWFYLLFVGMMLWDTTGQEFWDGVAIVVKVTVVLVGCARS